LFVFFLQCAPATIKPLPPQFVCNQGNHSVVKATNLVGSWPKLFLLTILGTSARLL